MYKKNKKLLREEYSQSKNRTVLEGKDIGFIAQTQTGLTQAEILKKYVKNWSELDLKGKRKVMGHIQKQRSMHAKEIFLKELSSIGRQI